jgi:hypothetical protein
MRIYSETVKIKYHLGNLHVVVRIILKHVGKNSSAQGPMMGS